MPKGRQYELDMQRDLREYVGEDTHVALPDRSGNAAGSYYDLEVINFAGSQCRTSSKSEMRGHSDEFPQWFAIFVELKKRRAEEGKRSIVMGGGHEGENGIEELARLVDGTPSWGLPVLAVKFDNRELLVFDAGDLRDHVTESGGFYDGMHGARLTDGGNLSLVKPELEEWPSSRGGLADHVALLRRCGFDGAT